jgi:hypothetical protein
MIAPIPTQYSGVLFRSKSEAIFARSLELRGYVAWEYEPNEWATEDGWRPDFWAIGKNKKLHKIFSAIIEYKPTMVTQAYFEQATRRFLSLGDKLHNHAEVIACGNSFDKERKTFVKTKNGWEEMEHAIGLFLKIEEAAKYRYDLASHLSK